MLLVQTVPVSMPLSQPDLQKLTVILDLIVLPAAIQTPIYECMRRQSQLDLPIDRSDRSVASVTFPM